VLPRLAQQTDQLLNSPIQSWEDAATPLVGTPVNKFEHLLQRVEPTQVQAMIEASKEAAPGEPAPAASLPQDGPEALAAEPLQPTITIDDFAKVDLRVARVLAAEDVPQAKTLLKLTLSLGGDERRTVFAGIKAAYDPAKLVGTLVVLAANLAPRQMTFGTSEGMVVASGPGGKDVFLLRPDAGAVPGQRVH
jgi:methionyl-tRNA synthetase